VGEINLAGKQLLLFLKNKQLDGDKMANDICRGRMGEIIIIVIIIIIEGIFIM